MHFYLWKMLYNKWYSFILLLLPLLLIEYYSDQGEILRIIFSGVFVCKWQFKAWTLSLFTAAFLCILSLCYLSSFFFIVYLNKVTKRWDVCFNCWPQSFKVDTVHQISQGRICFFLDERVYISLALILLPPRVYYTLSGKNSFLAESTASSKPSGVREWAWNQSDYKVDMTEYYKIHTQKPLRGDRDPKRSLSTFWWLLGKHSIVCCKNKRKLVTRIFHEM